jgi:hypothetical protein
MDIIELIRNIKKNTVGSKTENPFVTLEDELIKALKLYWSKAGNILAGSGINLLDPPEDYLSLERNFFSFLFLYSYFRADIPGSRRIIYAAINQCLRGLVTGCDNLLDDEYKKTLETDLPVQGKKFRSVMDILVSDRVLFDILMTCFDDREYDKEKLLTASRMSLNALTSSGEQEASEEGGVKEIFLPEQILKSVHHHKTGLLFKCPWAIPLVMEDISREKTESLTDALYSIGMGCQIMDDMVDLVRDLKTKRHNYVVSLISHGSNVDERELLNSLSIPDMEAGTQKDILLNFPQAMASAAHSARSFLLSGLGDLFNDEHQYLAEPAVRFLSMRIGAFDFLFEE